MRKYHILILDLALKLMKLSVIIVSYNVKQLLEGCLTSVIAPDKNTEVIVVDNDSLDGSVEYLKPRFPTVRFIESKENLGFAKACNQGWRLATGDCILFLNPDTIVPPQSLPACVSFLEQHPDAGALGVKMEDETGRFLKESKRGFPSPAASFFKLFGFASMFPSSKLFAKYYQGHLNKDKDHVVDVLSGAFMMVKKDVLQKTGGFDERFFMYGEDIDLSYRIQQAGYTNYYLGSITIIHYKGRSTDKEDPAYKKRFYDAMNLFLNKHYAGKKSPVFIAFIRLGIWVKRQLS
jgi:O-antigen biosynthesis protein